MSKTIKLHVYVETGFSNANHRDVYEVDREEWESLTDDEKDKMLNDYANEYLANCIDYGAYVDDEESE